MVGRQKVFALCWMLPGTSGCTLRFGADAFRVPSAKINDPSNTTAGTVSLCCSRLVCMECRLSIPPFLYINYIYSVVYLRSRFIYIP